MSEATLRQWENCIITNMSIDVSQGQIELVENILTDTNRLKKQVSHLSNVREKTLNYLVKDLQVSECFILSGPEDVLWRIIMPFSNSESFSYC